MDKGVYRILLNKGPGAYCFERIRTPGAYFNQAIIWAQALIYFEAFNTQKICINTQRAFSRMQMLRLYISIMSNFCIRNFEIPKYPSTDQLPRAGFTVKSYHNVRT